LLAKPGVQLDMADRVDYFENLRILSCRECP
jgi:hypothetical protein